MKAATRDWITKAEADPKNDATKSQARRALEDAKAIRREVRISFGLKV